MPTGMEHSLRQYPGLSAPINRERNFFYLRNWFVSIITDMKNVEKIKYQGNHFLLHNI